MSSQLVVIVDGSATSRLILERLSRGLGEEVAALSFADPQRAFSYCVEHRADLVIVADRAPLRAADTLTQFRSDPNRAHIPVLVVTDDWAGAARARVAGAGDHVAMPIDPGEFRLRAGDLLRRRAMRLERDAAAPFKAGAGQPERRRGGNPGTPDDALVRILDFIPAMVCVTDRDGRYVFVNHRFAWFVGVRADLLIGRRPIEAHDDELARSLAESNARIFAGEAPPGTVEEEVVDRKGQQRVLLATKSLLHADDGEDSFAVTVLLDITARKRGELDVLKAKEQAEIANRSKTEFLANMSHELRTPLNAIIGFSQVIAGEMLGPIGTTKYAGYARDILDSAERLLGIINDILEVSKLEAGRLEVAEEAIDVGKLVADLVQILEPKARAASVRIGVRREGEIPRLRADARKLKQIIANLLSNAIKFSHPGGGVDIVLRNAAGAVAIAVIDQGIGMDERELELAMTRFGQVAAPWARTHDGTGLGLPLALGLAELHGAELHLSSSKGAGTTATVTFPRERSLLAAAEDEPGAAAAGRA